MFVRGNSRGLVLVIQGYVIQSAADSKRTINEAKANSPPEKKGPLGACFLVGETRVRQARGIGWVGTSSARATFRWPCLTTRAREEKRASVGRRGRIFRWFATQI
jgi:hypothetical protein